MRIPLPPISDERTAQGFSGVLDDVALSASVMREGSAGAERWILEALFDQPPDVQALAALLPFSSDPAQWRSEALPDRDWLAHVHAGYPPFSVGRFFVRESHRTEPPPPDSILLTIDAVTAFGSGSHGTTRGCLEALCDLDDRDFRPGGVLDMGTGSGILGIAAWMLWRCPVLAVDIERESVRVACRHRTMNGVPSGPSGVTCKQGGRFDIRVIAERSPFDLILANILAAPLRSMARDLCAALAPGGRAVLSGMLQEQADEVLAAYEPFGVHANTRIDRGEWSTLVLVKKV